VDGIDLPGNGGPGTIGIFRVVTPGPVQNGTATLVHGDGFTLAVEFSQPIKVKALVSYGDCSQPGCKHHTDQLKLCSRSNGATSGALTPKWKLISNAASPSDTRQVNESILEQITEATSVPQESVEGVNWHYR
jgi:hypothetical protein